MLYLIIMVFRLGIIDSREYLKVRCLAILVFINLKIFSRLSADKDNIKSLRAKKPKFIKIYNLIK